ncbi:Type VIII secretion system (T8SS), CsgF protein [compost metagenome]
MNAKALLFSASLAALGSAQATELVYTPVNPSFGGNPLNGTWLLNNAQAQNDHGDDGLTRRTTSPLDRFTSQLQSRLLNDLLSNIQNGETGSLTTDTFIIDILDEDGVLSIVVTDRATGQVSEIVVNGF